MKKLLTTASACLLATQIHAGTMGPVVTTPVLIPFVIGEAAATWNKIHGATVFGNTASVSHDIWGGRGGAGFLYPYANRFLDNFGFSFEGGWGYYGSSRSSSTGTSPDGLVSYTARNYSQLWGFDLLGGVYYSYMPFDFFVKLGAMAENRFYRAKTWTTTSTATAIGHSRLSFSNTQTNMFPEIKVGGTYNWTDNLGFTVSYMHVFGGRNTSASIAGTFATATTPASVNASAALTNTELDSVMFGLVYKFL